MLLIGLNQIDADDPDLKGAVFLHAIQKTFAYMSEFGSIGLTKSGAFNRKFVHWAADNFDWPQYSRENMYMVGKALNENSYPPAMDVHYFLKQLRLGRHYKGQFVLTKAGQKFQEDPGGLFNLVAPVYLFEFDHFYLWDWDDWACGNNWDVVLNILNVEVEHGATVASLVKTLFGLEGSGDDPYWSDFKRECHYLICGTLIPLTRIGLMQEVTDLTSKTAATEYIKTPLWSKYFQLDTDIYSRPRVVH